MTVAPSLASLIADILNVSASDIDSTSGPLTLPTWDSLAHVTIVGAVEETFDVQLTMTEILAIKSVGDLQQLLIDRSIAF